MKTALKSEENREEKREAMKSIEKIYISMRIRNEKRKRRMTVIKKSKGTRGGGEGDDNFDGEKIPRRKIYSRDGSATQRQWHVRTEAER